MERKGFIGSSDIAAVMGLSRWKSPLALWAEKTGEIEPADLSDVEAVEWGIRHEPLIAEKFAEKHNVKLMAYKKRFIHKDYDYMQCELDRIIVGTDEAVEVKNVGAWKAKEWMDEDIPQEYILQHIWALGLSKRQKGNFAVLIGGQKYIDKKIAFDQGLFDKQVEAAKDFWENYVLKKVAPIALGLDNEDIVNLYPHHSEEMIEATKELEDEIARRQELSMHIKEMGKEKDEAEARIKQVIGTSLGIQTAKYKVVWKTQIRKSVDTDKMKERDIYKDYLKESESRVLRVTKNKEKEDGIQKKV